MCLQARESWLFCKQSTSYAGLVELLSGTPWCTSETRLSLALIKTDSLPGVFFGMYFFYNRSYIATVVFASPSIWTIMTLQLQQTCRNTIFPSPGLSNNPMVQKFIF